MSVFDQLLASIAPHDCLSCGVEGSVLCDLCSAQLPALPERCYHCRRRSEGYQTCLPCRRTSRLQHVQIATVYDAAAKDLVWQLKLAGRQAAASIMARRLLPLIRGEATVPVIVPVPTATSRVRERGYDQAALLARELARLAHLPCRNWLARHGQTHQHGLARNERLLQLATAFRVRQPRRVAGAHIILVDDVVTTGATLEAAAAVLQTAGAASVSAAIFAQTPVK